MGNKNPFWNRDNSERADRARCQLAPSARAVRELSVSVSHCFEQRITGAGSANASTAHQSRNMGTVINSASAPHLVEIESIADHELVRALHRKRRHRNEESKSYSPHSSARYCNLLKPATAEHSTACTASPLPGRSDDIAALPGKGTEAPLSASICDIAILTVAHAETKDRRRSARQGKGCPSPQNAPRGSSSRAAGRLFAAPLCPAAPPPVERQRQQIVGPIELNPKP